MRVNFSSKTCGPSLRTVQYTIEGSNTFRSASINGGEVTLWSGGIAARIGHRMMPTFPRSSLSFRTAGFPQYGWKAGISGGTFPKRPSA